jgi:hypothetical protein
MSRMEKLYLKERDGRRKGKIRRLIVIGLAALTVGGGAVAASAGTDFGPGQTENVAPQDPNAKCHGDPKLFGPECKE